MKAHLPPDGATVEMACGCVGVTIYSGTNEHGDHTHVLVGAPCPGGPPHLAVAGSGSAAPGAIEHVALTAVRLVAAPAHLTPAPPAAPIGAAA